MTGSRYPGVMTGMTPHQILLACDGYYESPKEGDKHIGPMVGYAARDEENKQLVGFHYANFAKIEEWPAICDQFVASPLNGKIKQACFKNAPEKKITFCGAPLGGLGLSRDIARRSGARCIYPEKVITAVKTPTSKEVSELVFGRHAPEVGDHIALVEDVCNNFSTTAKVIKLNEDRGARVVLIACFLNRSPFVGAAFKYMGREIPVVALWRQPMPEYKQSDGQAEPFIASGNVVLDPKKEWGRLMGAMGRQHLS